tara:strand:+ start:616 stop:930 length:315 start_codon:yes stop_codon:yes gene_type:complete
MQRVIKYFPDTADNINLDKIDKVFRRALRSSHKNQKNNFTDIGYIIKSTFENHGLSRKDLNDLTNRGKKLHETGHMNDDDFEFFHKEMQNIINLITNAKRGSLS